MSRLILVFSIFLISLPAYSYIGPGLSGGVIAAVIGFIVAIILGLWGILYYPIKRSLKNKRKKTILKKLDNEFK